MSGYYAANPHYAPVDTREDDERRERAEIEAGRWFDDLTKPQAATYHQRIQDIAPYKGSPRWLRDREAAQREFAETTKEASAICEMVFGDLMALGEVSEATQLAFEQVRAGVVMLQAAE